MWPQIHRHPPLATQGRTTIAIVDTLDVYKISLNSLTQEISTKAHHHILKHIVKVILILHMKKYMEFGN